MSLFEKHTPSDSTAFESSAEELAIINCFITWDNPKKDALVYRLIATCYEYCMLTIKKDNIMDTLTWRTGSGKSIWQTNDFIVSADQLLIGWSNDAYSGVPIVVLPSVWLSIILRFTGQTDDDYKSFCLFLTQRNHISHEDTIDPIQLLRQLMRKLLKQTLRNE